MLIFFAGFLFYVFLLMGLTAAHLARLRLAKTYPPTVRWAVAVIVPCKGHNDPRFEDNLFSIINQDYAGPAQFVFCVESDADTATPMLRALAHQFSNVQICIAGPAVHSAQKIFNVLQGMACAPSADIFLIADADIQPHATWLQEMVAPFQNPQISAVTGYYRRLPAQPHFQLGDYLAGVFTAVLTILTADNRVESLWGGSMALRKAVLDKYNLYEYLSTQVVDDLALMRVWHQYRLKRHFAPNCTLKSYCNMSTQDSIEWLARQFQYMQIYFKGLYGLLVLSILPCSLLALGLPVVTVYGLVSQDWLVMAGSIGAWLLALGVGWLLRLAAPVNPASVAPGDRPYRLLPWLLVTPLAAIGAGWALLKTIRRVKNGRLTMHWRDVTYRVDIHTGRVAQIIRE